MITTNHHCHHHHKLHKICPSLSFSSFFWTFWRRHKICPLFFSYAAFSTSWLFFLFLFLVLLNFYSTAIVFICLLLIYLCSLFTSQIVFPLLPDRLIFPVFDLYNANSYVGRTIAVFVCYICQEWASTKKLFFLYFQRRKHLIEENKIYFQTLHSQIGVSVICKVLNPIVISTKFMSRHLFRIKKKLS